MFAQVTHSIHACRKAMSCASHIVRRFYDDPKNSDIKDFEEYSQRLGEPIEDFELFYRRIEVPPENYEELVDENILPEWQGKIIIGIMYKHDFINLQEKRHLFILLGGFSDLLVASLHIPKILYENQEFLDVNTSLQSFQSGRKV